MSSSSFSAFVFSNDPENSKRSVQQVSLDDIAQDGVLIEVEWSSVNFKDGFSVNDERKDLASQADDSRNRYCRDRCRCGGK